jgi:hypothetical protein
MFDPAQLTLGQLSAAARDISIVGALVGASWKLRGVYETVTKFFERTIKHMDTMESGMSTLLNNHLAHMEQDLRKMAHNQVRASETEQTEYQIGDEAGK